MVTTTANAQKKQQKSAQQWQKRMMTRAHQWEAEDLEFAGLNRILTATGGSPQSFSSPSSAATGELPEIGNMISKALGSATSSARQAAMVGPERKLVTHQANIAKTGEGTAEHKEQEAVHDAEIAASNAVIADNNRAISNAATTNALTREQTQTMMDLTGMTLPKLKIGGKKFFGEELPSMELGGQNISGEKFRQLNLLIRMIQGREASTAK